MLFLNIFTAINSQNIPKNVYKKKKKFDKIITINTIVENFGMKYGTIDNNLNLGHH